MNDRAIARVVHGGGGDYTVHFTTGFVSQLSDLPSNATTHEISDRLKQIADAAQVQFQINRSGRGSPTRPALYPTRAAAAIRSAGLSEQGRPVAAVNHSLVNEVLT